MRLPAALLAVAVVAAGCGGADAPSRAEYATAADKICADVNRQVAKLSAGASGGALDRALTSLGKQLDDAVERLRDLDRPSGRDGDLAKRWIDQLSRDRDRFKQILAELRSALRARDPGRIRSASRRLDRVNFSDTDRLARGLGMKACAQ
ncbi:MAG TPA: hypothetical protein VGJ32_08960 [Solirubrobacteraceae bacterium]|jgi:hypothetical protein